MFWLMKLLFFKAAHKITQHDKLSLRREASTKSGLTKIRKTYFDH